MDAPGRRQPGLPPHWRTRILAGCLGLLATPHIGPPLEAASFVLPTPNRALFEPGGEERYFVGTPGRAWTSGTFGCVRTEGWQMHEGIDIRPLHRDRRGEPTDPVMAIADGRVAYANRKSSLSTYGIYLILQHHRDGLEFYSLYSHLSQIRPDLQPGQPVRAGETLGTLGHTANTAQAIGKDRAHLHLEINLLLHDHYPLWHQRNSPGVRNDHGLWNGRNFLGLDPRIILLADHRFGTNFNLLRFVRNQPVLCKVLVKERNFPWLHRHRGTLDPTPGLPPSAIAGYEVHLDFNGVPTRLLPRPADAFRTPNRFQLLEVNETIQRAYPCRKLVARRGDRWELGRAGTHLLDLLTFQP